MADIKQAFGTSTTLAITSAQSLAASAMTSSQITAAQSVTVSNTTNLFLDVMVQVQIAMTSTGTVGNGKAVYVYAVGSEDGSTWPNVFSAADATVAIDNPTPARLLGVVPIRVSNETVESSPMSLAAAFGGFVPRSWGIALVNDTNLALSSAATAIKYTGIYATSA